VLTNLALKNDRVTWVLVFCLIMSGLHAFALLPKAQDPGFIIRTAVVTTFLPGASPERVELLVTDEIEAAIQQMPEIDSIVSVSRSGTSIITANFKQEYKEMRPIFDDLRRKIEDVRRSLPNGVDGPIVNDSFGDVFGSVYALTGDGFSYAQLKEAADKIRNSLLTIDDVAKVDIHGAQQEVVYVEYDTSRLQEAGLTPQQLQNALNSLNVLSTGGSVIAGGERILLEPTGNFESVAALKSALIKLPSGQLVQLGDITHVRRAYVDPADKITRVNGRPSLAIAVAMREGGDILSLGRRLDRFVPEMMQDYPHGLELEKIWFQAELVEDAVDSFLNNLLQSVGIVILVMVLFLGFRTGLVVASLIPVTMIIVFFVMRQFGVTVNQVSLAALIIALGLLVDNAIVMVESILVKREQGQSAFEAAVGSGRELALPLLVSSLTTAAAFLPIALAKSNVGEFTADLFNVVTMSLLVSWVLAMTFIPLFATKAIETRKEDRKSRIDGVQKIYARILQFCVRHKVTFFAAVLASFFFGMFILGFVPKIFFPASDDPVFSAALELPQGTSIESTEEMVKDVDRFMWEYYDGEAAKPILKNWMTFIGEGGPRFQLSLDPPEQNPSTAFMIGSVHDAADAPLIIEKLGDYVQDHYPDMNAQIGLLATGPPVGYPIQIRLKGTNAAELTRIAQSVIAHLYTLQGVYSVANSWGRLTKKLVVNIDQARAQRAQVSSQDVATSLQTNLSGIDLSQYREDDKLIPITLRSVAADRRDVNKLESVTVYSSASGSNVPLSQVADIELVFEPGLIKRRDRERTLTLNVQLTPGVTASEINEQLSPWLETQQQSWPNGYYYEEGGEAEESGKANQSIADQMPLAGMVILLLLVSQFNSVRKPVIILLTIPLGLIGVSVGLLLAQSYFGFMTFLGVISLSGIIINNAIVLIDRIQIEQEENGLAPDRAILQAAITRFRPILLTTATTVLGMLPLWWGGTGMFEPLAIAIIFGLAFATLLTLLVVPVMYATFFGVKFKKPH
jgi:multidrug efflux pump subunit AcrB